jgi:transmembrane sensor
MAESGKSDEAVRLEAADWLAQIHDPETAVDRGAFELWRAADPRHAIAFARAERAWDSAELLGQTSFGRERALPERRRFQDRKGVYFALAATIVALALFGLSAAGLGWFRSQQAPGMTEYASRIGEIRQVKLPDGSSVTLDTDSALRIAFAGDERRLYLERGRARFDVAHDAARPFIVVAGKGSVTALGTIFDVTLTGDRVQVTLLRGAVEVRETRMKDAGAKPAVARLSPGQQIAFGGAAPLAAPEPAAQANAQWTRGMLNFDRTRLADAIAEANRYSAVRISLADAALGDLRVTGAYRVGDAAGLAESLAASLGLRATKTPDGGMAISGSPTTDSTPSK